MSITYRFKDYGMHPLNKFINWFFHLCFFNIIHTFFTYFRMQGDDIKDLVLFVYYHIIVSHINKKKYVTPLSLENNNYVKYK